MARKKIPAGYRPLYRAFKTFKGKGPIPRRFGPTPPLGQLPMGYSPGKAENGDMRPLFFVLVLPLLTGAAGFAANHEITLEALCFPAAARGPFFSYRIAAAPGTLNREEAQVDALRHVRTALSGHGLFEAPAGVAPDLEIEVTCGLGGAQTEIRTHTVAVQSAPLGDPIFATNPVTHIPVHSRVTVFQKHLMISARTARSAENVWRIQASLANGSRRLEAALPVLAAAIMNVVGYDTQGTTMLKLSSKDADVLFIHRGLDEPGPRTMEVAANRN
jgi:hypothetical protein